MKTFMTRHRVCGILMAFVLAVSVQGTADAISRLTRSSGDLQTVTAGDDYQIRFSVTLQSPVRGSTYTNYKQTPSANVDEDEVTDKRNKTTYYDDNNGTSGYQDETQVTYDTVYDYDQESIAITVSGGSLKKVGSHDASGTSLTMYESTHNSYSTTSNPHQRLSGSVTLTLTAPTTAAVVTITIDPTTDGPSGHTEPPDLIFTVYVVGPLNAAGTTAVADATDGVELVSDESDTQINTDFTFSATHQPVYYSVEGNGRLYVSLASDRKTNPTKTLYTSSSAPVYLDTNAGSSKVTAYISGSRDTATVLYIFSGGRLRELPQITIQGGNGQTGAPSGRLDDYFEVKVTDGKRRAMSGVPVTFTGSDPSTASTGSMFIPVSGTRLYIDANGRPPNTLTRESIDAGSPTTVEATAISPEANQTHHVQTDRNGVAKIYYQLSDSSGAHKVTATAYGVTGLSETLTATASSSSRARIANLEIVSGNNQRAKKGEDLTEDLVVIVRSLAGHRVQDVIVQFRTTTGILVPSETTTQPDAVLNQNLGTTLHPRTGQQIYVETGADGEAGVTYNIGQLVEARDVIAEVREEAQDNTQYDFAIDRVIFKVNGGSTGGGGGGSPPPATTQTPSLSISVADGETSTTRRVTVNASDGRSVVATLSGSAIAGSQGGGSTPGVYRVGDSIPRVPGLILVGSTFTFNTTLRFNNSVYTCISPPCSIRDYVVTQGTIQESGSTGTTQTGGRTVTTGTPTTITVPTTPGTYTIQASASGYTVAETSITVAQIAPGTLAIEAVGARSGTQQQLRVTVAGGPTIPSAGLVVTLHGVTLPRTVTIPSGSTSASRIATLPSATSAHSVYASATGYTDSRTLTIPAPGTDTTPTPTPTVPEPSSIEVSGPATRSGTVNTQLSAPLLARVLDEDGTGVGDARVIFRVRKGQGRLSQRGDGRAIAIETDSNGHARADYTPMSASSTVEATVRGVSQGVTFTITTGSAPDTAASDTAAAKTYKRGTEIPISLDDTLTFTGSRTISGTVYTCDGSGECVVSYGTVVKGQIQAAAVPKVAAKTYKRGTEIPISLDDTLTFTGSRTISGMTYTCDGSGECVVSYGTVVKGQIQAAAPTPSTTPGTSITDVSEVVLRVPASNRPVMYSVAGGALYRLGAEVTEIAASATDVAVGGNKLYWIEEKTAQSGAVHTSDLDGRNPSVVKELTSVPKGLTLANGKLYLTNGWGKIQRMNVDGTQFETNFLTNVGKPQSIAVSGSRVYWTDGSGRVRHAPLQGQKTIRNIATGSGALGGLAVDGRRVYWTETTGERSGRVRSANLDGTGIADAYTVTATVHGLAIDPANNQLYWTNGWGKVQRGAPSRGDVVTGLGTPTALAIGGANTETAPTPAKTPTKSTTTAGTSKYDVNGDGTVDSTDVDVILLAVSAGVTLAKYDVNGDGKVDITDVITVNGNLDKGAAAAPTLLGKQFSAFEIERLQEQVELLIATNDRSPAAMKTLIYLQQLIATARPEKTQLLANYPNPFNPETWIPYELATDTNVKITIYNAQGIVIRTLQLGQQSAGYYTDRERSAYWDGRNALGEQVASGVYFYQLETDEMSSLRKMVILK